MQLGVSSYSFAASIEAGRMDVLDVVDWVARSDADHLELAQTGLGHDLPAEPDLVAELGARAAERGVPLVNYAVAADFREGDLDAAVEGVLAHVEVARALGVPRLRHDVVAWAWREGDEAEFEELFARVVPACQRIAESAAALGVATSVEDHGFCFNGSERVQRLAAAVDRPSFSTLLDVGNFLCVDEDPLEAVRRSLPTASVVHLKDFHVRERSPGEGWLTTLGGAGIRGTVVGDGDLPLREILAEIRTSGFDGPMSIEFEGPEDDGAAVEKSLAAVRVLWAVA